MEVLVGQFGGLGGQVLEVVSFKTVLVSNRNTLPHVIEKNDMLTR